MAKTKGSVKLNLREKATIKTGIASGKTVNKVAGELKRSNHVIKRYAEEPETKHEISSIKQELSTLFNELARRMIESINAEDISKISAYQRTIAAAAATDKARALQQDVSVLSGISGNRWAAVAIAIEAEMQAGYEQRRVIEIGDETL